MIGVHEGDRVTFRWVGKIWHGFLKRHHSDPDRWVAIQGPSGGPCITADLITGVTLCPHRPVQPDIFDILEAA